MGVLCIVAGATFLAIAPVTQIIPAASELTLENWSSRVGMFVLLLWFFVTAGLALIGWPFALPGRSRIRLMLVCCVVGACVSLYPGLLQMAVGASEVTGVVDEVVQSTAEDKFKIDPQSNKVSKQRVKKIDVIQFQTSTTDTRSVKLIRSDSDRVVEAAKTAGANQEVKVIYLKYFRQLLEVNAANP